LRMETIGWIAVAIVLALSVGASACMFYFNYESIDAPLGTLGQVGIRVEKTHNRCVLPDMDSYELSGEGIQILARTPWEEVADDVYETWVTVSLSNVGEGRLTISKTCSKEGLEQGDLPILITEPDDDGVWAEAMGGAYPWDPPEEGIEIRAVQGVPRVIEQQLYIEDIAVDLGTVSDRLLAYDAPVWVYASSDLPGRTLLIVGDGFFYRYDRPQGDGET